MSDETCGNGVIDEVNNEHCDSTPNCSDQCKLQMCGNGMLDRDEKCDDNNKNSGDGCSADCLSIEVCGNGIIDSAVREECEFPSAPFPTRPSDRADCDSDCTLSVCGDGHTNSLDSEQCDPGQIGQDSEGCDKDCSLARCGDAYRNIAAGEECDDGEDNSSTQPDKCRLNCKSPHCGDDVVDPDRDEDCDDGNNVTSDSCPSGPNGTCEPARCGDGFLKTSTPNPEVCEKTGNLGCDTNQTCNNFCTHCDGP